MKIRTKYIKDTALIGVEGKININSSKLIEAIGSILDSGVKKIVVDMDKVDFVDYNGLSVLAIAYKSALNQKGVMKLCGISLHILELLRVVKLDEVFDIYINTQDALDSFGKKRDGMDPLAKPLRRRFTRLEMDTPVHFRLTKGTHSKSASDIFSGRVANISGSGIFIRTINLFPPGCHVDMTIALRKGKKPKTLKGVVMWLADKGLQPDFYPGMGIEFNSITRTTQEDIIVFIEKNAVHRNNIV
ncbi:MAG: STAS domain-containing protein [Candidatus Omnitrophota bacterium]